MKDYALRNNVKIESDSMYITTKGIEHSLREKKVERGSAVTKEEIADFIKNTGLMEQLSKDGCRLKSREGAVNNFNEWVKFSKYAEKFL